MKIVVGNNVYNGDCIYVESCLKMARVKYENENVNALYAVEKSETVHMLKQTYTDHEQLMEAVQMYESKGFKCYYIMKKEDI